MGIVGIGMRGGGTGAQEATSFSSDLEMRRGSGAGVPGMRRGCDRNHSQKQ